MSGMRTTDEGQGPTLLFVHGFPLSREAWRGQVDRLRGGYRVVAPDLPGFGESPARPGPLTMDRLTDDVRGLLARLAPGPAVLIGHSMGGYVALAFVRRFPEMLSGLVLVGTRAGKDTPEAAAARRATAEKVGAGGTGVVIDAMAPKMLSPANRDPGMAREVRTLMAGASPEGVIGALLGMAERPDATPTLAGILVPTLVVTGQDDALIPPAESEALARAIPGAWLRIIPQAGHLVALERPEAFHGILKGWLEKNPVPGTCQGP